MQMTFKCKECGTEWNDYESKVDCCPCCGSKNYKVIDIAF